MNLEFKESLRREPVIDLDPTPALTIHAEATVEETLASMRDKRAGCVIVVDAEGRVDGIFTERDVIRRVLGPGKPLSTPVSRVMTAGPKTLSKDDTAAQALKLFTVGRVRHLPVVDEDGRPTGVVSVKRLVRYLAENCPESVYCLPPDPERVSTELYSG